MDDETVYQDVNETIRQQFESSWIAGKPQPIEVLIGDTNAPNYLATLEELVHIELEFCWKTRSPLQRVELEDYLERFQQLNQPEIVNRLIQQEVRLRTAIGETPVAEEYQNRFQNVTVDFPTLQQAQQDTDPAGQAHEDTSREMPTIMPPSSELPDSHETPTLAGPDAVIGDFVVDADAVPGYDLLGELGRGGMGVVYKARDQNLKRTVALKMILSGAHASDEDMQRFQIEAEAVAKLQHPNIVQIYEVSEHEGRPYIALEFADGGSLDEKIAGKPQDQQESAQLIETLAGAMQLAHENDIIHRDLKPANILLNTDGEPRITDFGLAKRMDEDSNQTKSGAVMGTPSYMAPEQAGGKSDILGPATDTYALGAILYHMLAGRPPFRAATQLDTIMQVLTEEPVAPRKLNPALAVDLETICLKCLEKDVHRRYESAAALGEDLRRFQSGEPILARPVTVVERSWKWAKRRPAVAGMISVSALALMGLVLFGLSYNTQLKKQRDASRQQTKAAKALTELSELRENETKTREILANRLRNEAEQARLETLQRMAYSNVETGEQLQKAGDLSASLVWYADALRLDQGSSDRERIHRQRLAQMISVSFRPKHIWFPETPTAGLHGSPGIIDVGFSPDFQKVVASTADGVIYLWDIESGNLAGEPLEHEGGVSDIAFDHTGNLLAAAVLINDLQGKSVSGLTRIWDLSTGKRRKERFRQDGGTALVAFHPHKKQLMAASARGRIDIWDIESGELLVDAIEHPRGSSFAELLQVLFSFSPDGAYLLTSSDDGSARIWDSETGQLAFPPVSHNRDGSILQVSFNSDGDRFLTASKDDTAQVWDVKTGMPVTPPMQHEDDVFTAIFSPDDRRIATASINGDVRVWDSQTGEPLTSYLKHPQGVNVIEFSPNGQFVATGSDDGFIRFWRAKTGLLQRPLLRQNGKIRFVTFHPDGRHLLTASDPASRNSVAEVRLWDLAASAQRPVPLKTGSPRHARFVPGSNRVLVADREDGLQLFDSKTKEPLTDIRRISGDIIHFEFDRSGTRVVTATAAGVARVWDTTTLKPQTPQMILDSALTTAHFNQDGSRLITVTENQVVRLWDAVSGKPLADPIKPEHDVEALFHPDGQMAVFNTDPYDSRSDSGPLTIWSLNQQGGFTAGGLQLEPRIGGLDFKTVNYSLFSPAGDVLVCITLPSINQTDSYTAFAFDVQTGDKIFEINYDDNIYGAAFNHDGTRLLLYSRQQARVWNGDTGEAVSPWIQTGGKFDHVVFSPDGLLLATAEKSIDNFNVVRVWDALTGQSVTTDLVDNDRVFALDFSSDSTQLLTRSDQVRIWQLPPDNATLGQLTHTARFLSAARLDESGAMRSLNADEQREAWEAFREDSGNSLVGTAEQVRAQLDYWYGLSIRDGDTSAVQSHLQAYIRMESKVFGRAAVASTNLGDFDTACENLQELLKVFPDEQCYYRANYVMLLFLSGDLGGFRRENQLLLERFGETTDGVIAERVAKSCCLDPIGFSADDLRMQLAERAFQTGAEEWYSDYAQLTCGMAYYRTGQYARALELLEPLSDMTVPPGRYFEKNAKITAKFVAAMSYHQLGKPDVARETLQTALKFNQLRGEIDEYSTIVFDWLRCDIIEAEAVRLLQTVDAAPFPSK